MEAKQPLLPLCYRAKEAAEVLRVSPRFLHDLTVQGLIPVTRVGAGKRRTLLYSAKALEAWLENPETVRELSAGKASKKGGDHE